MMKQRVITALVLLAVLAVIVWQINTPIFIIAIAFFSAVAANEIMKCAKISNKFLVVAGTAFAAVVPFLVTEQPFAPWFISKLFADIHCTVPNIVYVILITLAFFLAMLKGYSHTSFENVAVAFFAGVVVPFDFSLFVKLRDIELDISSQFGIYVMFYALICALATDTGAQLGGMAFGKHKMAPTISPKKTKEGAVCGIIFGIILNVVAILLYNKFANTPLDKSQMIVFIACSPVVGFMGMMGDLSASVLKRNFGVKDFGKIFPGHGGVMDRLDSTLFTLPLAYIIAAVMENYYALSATSSYLL
ncbi:MAG: phosphatidate cytidylyltransferase [Eubacterium sp.]